MLYQRESVALAYQRLEILEIRKLYDDLYHDLERSLELRDDIGRRISSLQEKLDKIEEGLSSRGVDLSAYRELQISLSEDMEHLDDTCVTPEIIVSDVKEFKHLDVTRPDDFQELVSEAESYLEKKGIDLEKDPILQVITGGEAAGIYESFSRDFGDISLDNYDYLVVVLAGFIGTLLDIFLVKIPTDINFLGTLQEGSPVTKWIREHSEDIHEKYLKGLEKIAHVPYDNQYNKAIEGLHAKLHRLMSPGHDPILGFLLGVQDILSGTGTYIDKNGNIIMIPKGTKPVEVSLVEAFLKVFLHLLSDVFTKMGVQPPLFTLLQLVKAESPFVLSESGVKVTWTDAARYMYANGYDFRHYIAMGIVPGAVSMIVRGWCLCRSYLKDENSDLVKAKTASMLVMSNAIVLSGNLIKTGGIYHMNPLAINWSVVLNMPPLVVSWILDSIKWDARVSQELDAELVRIYKDTVE